MYVKHLAHQHLLGGCRRAEGVPSALGKYREGKGLVQGHTKNPDLCSPHWESITYPDHKNSENMGNELIVI